MAHMLSTMTDGRTAMAFVGKTPWHGLGQALTAGASFDTWQAEAGMDFEIMRAVAQFSNNGTMHQFSGREVLFRSDNKRPLAVVSDGYKIVQPAEVLEFFRDLCARLGFTLETAGVMYDGARYWALARVPLDFTLKGGDRVGAYVLLATSCDGTMSTVAQFTSVRVVCNNTLRVALGNGKGAIRVRHSTEFRATQVKVDMGLAEQGWQDFERKAVALADRKMTQREALGVLIDVMGDPAKATNDQPNARPMAEIMRLYSRYGIANDQPSTQSTAWGLLNAATEYYDHHAGRTDNSRLASAWFGKAAETKTTVYETLIDRVLNNTVAPASPALAPTMSGGFGGGLLDAVLDRGIAA